MVSEVSPGREPVVIVQMDLDLPTPVSYEFGTATVSLPVGVIPTVQKVDVTPSELNIGGRGKNTVPLGRRAQVKVQIEDHVEEDTPGSWWSAFMAKHPYFELRPLRILTGYAGQARDDMLTRHYLIDSIDGPDARGKVTITGKDVLAIADNDRAQVPPPTSGVLVDNLAADQAGAIEVAGAWGDYATAPVGEVIGVRINDEVMVGELGSAGAESFTITVASNQRAQFGTEASNHESGDVVQLVDIVDNERPDELIERLLVDYGAVPSEYIPTAAWQAEADVWLESFRVSFPLSESEGVLKVIGEITQQTGCYIWWDELERLIKFRAIRPVLPDDVIPVFSDEANILANSTKVERRPEERISTADVSYLPRNVTADLEKESNYRRRRLDVNIDSATKYRQNRIMKIYSRWLDSGAKVINLSARLVSRYKETPVYLTFEMDAKDRAVKTGDVIDVRSRYLTDESGSPVTRRWVVISSQEIEHGHRVRYRCQEFEFPLDGNFGTGYMADDAPDYLDADSAELEVGSWYSDEDGLMSDGSPGVVYV